MAGDDWIVRAATRINQTPGGERRTTLVPTAGELQAEGLVAPTDDPYRYFDSKERATVDWLAANGVSGIRSVRTRDRPGEPTPDTVFDHAAGLATLEMKAPDKPSEGAIDRGVRYGRKQSRIVVIDCRHAGTELNTAESGLRRAISHHGQDVDQVIVVVSDGSAIGWRP